MPARFSRRTFVLTSSAGVALGGTLQACGGSEPASVSMDGGGAMPDGHAPDAGRLDAAPSDSGMPDAAEPTPGCIEETAPNIEGPFYVTGTPERTELREAGVEGVHLVITGRVFDLDCRPIAGAFLDFWQADRDGAYDDGQRLRGHQFTDDEGRYRLDTIMPGHYLNGDQFRPAHIHVKVAAQGLAGVLTTQLYFEDDPYNDIDPFIVDTLIMPVQETLDGARAANFDFVVG